MTHWMIGIIGGSGLYTIDAMEDVETLVLDTPWGAPSDTLLLARLQREGKEGFVILGRRQPSRRFFLLLQLSGEDGLPEPRIAEAVALDVPVDDLTGLDPGAREVRVAACEAAEAAAPFDLAVPPLLRARLLRLAADDHRLVLALHHLVGAPLAGGLRAQSSPPPALTGSPGADFA
ncbi:chondramide synthase cmdD-like [Zingiber officinale]|uniref:chondramide synthase cmdD-like n=1 Tax=Zingiber officinale TaxID=94328 RepID=UPI001C4CAF90|nr:chondramide synthase cmdD-like [Zingiber officinale]